MTVAHRSTLNTEADKQKHNGEQGYIVVKYYPHLANSEEPISPVCLTKREAEAMLMLAKYYRPRAVYSLRVEQAAVASEFLNSRLRSRHGGRN